MEIYLVRHGQTQYNVDRLYYGFTDCPLTETGHEQAGKLGEFFADISYKKIITSDLIRAKTTAVALNLVQQKEIEQTSKLREMNFGDWEGRDYKYIKDHYPEEVKLWEKDWSDFTIPNGEAFMDFYERVTSELVEIIKSLDEKDTCVIVCHSGVISCMLCYFIGVGPSGFWRFFSKQEAYSLVSINKGNAMIDCINSPLNRLK